jgi:transcriptional regulator with XRE-family HTH domain
VREAESWLEGARATRDLAIRTCAAEGMKLETIARITGMTKQRISQIVRDGR